VSREKSDDKGPLVCQKLEAKNMKIARVTNSDQSQFRSLWRAEAIMGDIKAHNDLLEGVLWNFVDFVEHLAVVAKSVAVTRADQVHLVADAHSDFVVGIGIESE
jgi:hypothetical protein